MKLFRSRKRPVSTEVTHRGRRAEVGEEVNSERRDATGDRGQWEGGGGERRRRRIGGGGGGGRKEKEREKKRVQISRIFKPIRENESVHRG